MSIFGSIMSKIFGTHAETTPASASTAAGGGSGSPSTASSSPGAAGSTASVGKPGTEVDVGKVLSDLNAKHGGKLNYKQSIVDLMMLLEMDSSLTARKALADELHYTGDKNDTYTMNVWLIKQVTKKLAENGGKLPDDMKHA